MEILKVNSKNFDKIIKKVIEYLKEGKVVVCPTDTVYGLLVNAKDKKAVEKIFKIKKRRKNKPLPLFVKDIKMVKSLAKISKKEEKFLKKFWPGKITVILKYKNKNLPQGTFDQKNKKIGLRIPDYKLINNIFKKINFPLSGTSANISGKAPSTKIKEIIKQFQNQKHQPDLIIEAGNLPKSQPSTIIDLTEKEFKILRQGEVKIKKTNF
jgi:L-threonylcarbamoyladenylate synthase